MPPVEVRHGRFYATVGVDLRYTDAVILQAYGPMKVDVGGLMGETVLRSEIHEIIDGWRERKHFSLRSDAEIWQRKTMYRIRDELFRMRGLYMNDYPR